MADTDTDLKCLKCKTVFTAENQGKLLPCLHTFCDNCISLNGEQKINETAEKQNVQNVSKELSNGDPMDHTDLSVSQSDGTKTTTDVNSGDALAPSTSTSNDDTKEQEDNNTLPSLVQSPEKLTESEPTESETEDKEPLPQNVSEGI